MRFYQRSKNWDALAVLALALLFCISYGLREGQDVNWDLRNYHLYSVYALLHGREGLDLAPAQLQTWTNPFGSLVAYFLVMHVKPIWGSVILSSFSALNIWMVYLIARTVCRPLAEEKPVAARWLVALATIPAAFGPVFLSVVGTTFNDNFVAFCILTAVYFALQEGRVFRSYVFAGVFLGLAAALKLTAIVYVGGFALAVIFVNPLRFYRQALASMGGFLCGFLPFGGTWMIYVYSLFGNPVFPLYNNVFKSPLMDPVAMKDDRYIYTSAKDFFEKPIELATGGHPGIETYMLDSRYLLFLVVLLLCLPLMIDGFFRRFGKTAAPTGAFGNSSFDFLIIFVLANYILWGLWFGIMRYAVALEQLIPLCIIMLLALIASEWRRLVLISIGSSMIISASANAGNWGRVDFSDNWFEFGFPEAMEEPDTAFVMLSGQGMSYLAPYLPASDRFIRFQGNMNFGPESGLGRNALEILSQHNGQIRTLSEVDFDDVLAQQSLAAYGLQLHEDRCLTVSTNTDDLKSCLVTKVQ